MDNKLGLFIVTIALLATAVPAMILAEPTRTMNAEITNVVLDGPTAASGEFAKGDHTISIILNNTGDQDFMQFVDFYVNVTYNSNGTVYHFEKINKVVFIANNSMSTVDLLDINLPEGMFDVSVNATIGLQETGAVNTFDIADVVDLSIVNMAFTEGYSYPLGESIVPVCNVSFNGNMEGFADTVDIGLVIETGGDSPEEVYNETMEILTPASPPVNPGKYWIASFPSWTSSASGPFIATFSVNYDSYNTDNNEDAVSFEVANPPVIEGWVTTDDLSPIPGVDVTVSTSPETLTTTDSEGYYSFFDIAAGNYSVVFSKKWVSGNVTTVQVVPGVTKVINTTLLPLQAGGLRGHVSLPDGTPAAGALIVVSVPESPLYTINTNSTGYYEIEELPAGNATITASMSGYQDDVVQTTIAIGAWNEVDLELAEIPFNVSFSVPDGEPAFPIYDSISVFFTRPIDRTSVDYTTLILRKLSTGDTLNVAYSFADSDKTVVMTPEVPLEYSTEYQIEVTSWIKDVNGDFFPAPVYSTFTTEGQIQEIHLVSFSPLDDANEVPINTVVSAVFPVAMDAGTIHGSTFQLIARGGALVDAVVTYDNTTRTAYLNPTGDLAYGTRYSVSLDSDISPMDPQNVFNGFTWSFETKMLVTTGTLTGTVLDENGHPFDPSQVTVELKTGVANVITKRPDQNGRFQFLDVEEGLWTLSIKVNGYKEYSQEYSITAGESTTIDQPIQLEKETSSTTSSIPWPVIFLIVIAIILIIVIGYYLLNRPKEEAEGEEEHHRPRFAARREEPAFHGGYDELAEGEFMCPVCGSVVDAEDTICPVCGSEFEEDIFECPECGATIPADATVCPECGAEFEEEEEESEEEDLYGEEEEIDITGDFEVEDIDTEELPFLGMDRE